MFSSILSTARTTATRASFANIRTIHSTPVAAKTVTEKVSDVADKVNKKVGQGLASAIETGEKATQATKETIGGTAEQTQKKAEEASKVAGQKVNQGQQKAEEMSKVAGQKVNQAASGARQAKEDFEREATR